MTANARPVPRDPPTVEVAIASTLWEGLPEAEATVHGAIAAASALCDTVPSGCEVSVVLTDDAAIQSLNKLWRGIDRPTNVLSFPVPASPAPEDAPQVLGDIVIAYEYLGREAAAEGKAPLAHLAHLTVHGFLHLVGYDHATGEEATLMEGLETRILATLGLPDPYAWGGPARRVGTR